MTPKPQIRAIATTFLRAAAKIAPPRTAEWAQAMVAELHHIEGDWPALAWSIGSAAVLAKHAIFDLFVPNHARSEGNFFGKEKPMRRSTAIAAAICIAASLLFFAAPTFREAFQLSVIQWRSLIGSVVNGGGYYLEANSDYVKIGEQAEKKHDAEGLAFAALHRRFDPSAAKWADEAVKIDPQLTWVYAVFANGLRPEPEINYWIANLEQFDPRNAIPHLIQAEVAQTNDFVGRKFVLNGYLSDPAWLNAMSAAFSSPEIDTYADRVKDLDRKVALRYAVYGPQQASREYFLATGASPAMGTPMAYIKILLDSGDASAARGDYQGAEKQYRLAAHFGEMVEASHRAPVEAFRNSALAAVLLQKPYERLAALYQEQGDQTDAQHFAGLAAVANSAWREGASERRALIAGGPSEERNAKILGLAGIALFLCLAMIPLCAILMLIKSRSVQLSNLKTGLFTRALGRCSVIGLLVSTAALYFSYRPYADIVRNYLQDGNPDRLLTLGAFLDDLNYSQTPPTHQTLYSLWSFPMYFWAGVIVLCGIALSFVTAKFFWNRRSAIPG